MISLDGNEMSQVSVAKSLIEQKFLEKTIITPIVMTRKYINYINRFTQSLKCSNQFYNFPKISVDGTFSIRHQATNL